PLPLADLLLDLATTCRVDVLHDPDLPIAGWCDIEARTIWLNPAAPIGMTFDEVVAHEIAHLIDPRLGKCGAYGDEVFANTLAAALLAHQPRTLAEALHMAAAADDRFEPIPADGAVPELPATPVASALAFIALPVINIGSEYRS